MISESCIYWITRLDKILSTLDFIGGICGCMLILCFFIGGMTYIVESLCEEGSKDYEKAKETRQYFYKGFLISTIAFALMGTMSILIPTSKELAAIYVIPKVANNERIQNFSSEIATIAEDWLKELKTKSQGAAKGERK